MKFTVSNTVWREDRDSIVGGRFCAVDSNTEDDVTAERARELVVKGVAGSHRCDALLADWDRQMLRLGRASVHLVVDGSVSEAVEYGLRMSFHP